MDWEKKEQQDFDNFVHDTESKLNEVKKLDLGALALDEARDMNHKLKD